MKQDPARRIVDHNYLPKKVTPVTHFASAKNGRHAWSDATLNLRGVPYNGVPLLFNARRGRLCHAAVVAASRKPLTAACERFGLLPQALA